MDIKGIQKTSLVDYPGNLCSILFLSKCNFACPFCYNPELVKDYGKAIPEEEILEFLGGRRHLIDGVCVSGGEPTIHKELPELLKKLKDLKLLVKLDTNGANPEMLKKVIQEELVDYVAMDIKSDFDNYEKCAGTKVDIDAIKESIKILKGSKIDYEFRTTLIKEYHTKEIVEKISHQIAGAKKYYLQTFFEAPEMLVPQKYTAFTQDELKEIKELSNKYVKTEIRTG